MNKIIEKAEQTNHLDKNEIISLLKIDNENLFKAADRVRKKYKGDFVHLRGLIEFTNICRCNCFYCGLRKDNSNLERFRLTEDEILICTQRAVNAGYKTVVLQGGEDLFFTPDKICRIIREIKKYDIAVTLSIGERSFEEYKAFKDAGADRYLLRIETTDENLYKSLHPGMSLENRKNCLYNLKKLGYETGSGCIVGLPNQTVESKEEVVNQENNVLET